jgi:hypothetical protein
MNPDNEQLQTLRNLIMELQRRPLSESELTELNTLICSEAGAFETATLLDQLAALADADAASPDSTLVPEILSKAMGNSAATQDEFPRRTDLALWDSVSSRSDFDEVNSIRSDQNRSAQKNPGQWTKFHWLLAIAASSLIAASWAWSLAKSLSTDPQTMQVVLAPVPEPESDSSRLLPTSPQLVSMTACVWRPSGDAVPAIGKPLQSGEILNLVEGIAELKIGEGTASEALVRIEGPARAYIRADGQIGILNGSMTVKSRNSSNGTVTVHSPLGKVIADGQASIGLVASDSECEVHLFTGQAIVTPYRLGLEENEIDLAEGEAARLSSHNGDDIIVVKFEAAETSFASARSPGFDPLDLGEEYVQAVMESRPSIYWRFEELKGESPRYVENQGSALGINAVAQGNPAWRQYGSNRVAELGLSTSSAFRSSEPWPAKPLDEYSIELWVKPQLLHHGEVLCLHEVNPLKNGRHQHTVMLETVAQHFYSNRLSGSPSNRFRFVHRPLGASLPISATSLFAGEPYQPRVWQHVVAMKKKDRQTLWVDGQLSAERVNRAQLDENTQILLGQVYPGVAIRRFVGQIDEVAIYDHCLTPQEMRKHIRAAGRPVTPKPKK